MDAHLEENDYFFISKDFDLKENEEVEFLNFHDLTKQTNYILTIREGNIFFCTKLDYFGSLFFGNYAYEEPMTVLIKPIDPTLLLINIIYSVTGVFEGTGAGLTINDIVRGYIEKLSVLRSDQIDEVSVESTKEVLRFLTEDYYVKNKSEIDKICESLFVSYTNSTHYKLKMSKILSFMDKKLSACNKEHYRNCLSILASFLPDAVIDKFLEYKGCSLDEIEEYNAKVVESSNSNIRNFKSADEEAFEDSIEARMNKLSSEEDFNLKRKWGGDNIANNDSNNEHHKVSNTNKKEKKKQDTAKKAKEEVPKNQATLFSFIKPKK